ncbi:zinc ribbon domain-containing protein [Paenibacillus sp. GCM10023252]|uniref:zinc ribbon domain-containing protein n=1 Tax=Paenibacillus sp. GCM10023252 TaxID=3252649 RepID=UPI0036125968
MIECPWCSSEVELDGTICPVCRHEVMPQHLVEVTETELVEGVVDSDDRHEAAGGVESGQWDNASEEMYNERGVEDQLANTFECMKCKHDECEVREVAMSGTGLSRLMDMEYNEYLFVSCMNCGYVEVYDPQVLKYRRIYK